jgi:hypothetical protein
VSSPVERRAALASALAALGVPADVDADGPLAVLRPRDAAPSLDAATRAAVVDAARRCGFTHVALEL